MPASLGQPDGRVAEQYWDALLAGSALEREPPDCGSGCDGRCRPWDCGRPGLSALECRLLGRDVARRIREHRRQRGDLPAGWERWADEILDPVVSWRHLLASAVRRGVADVAGRVDFTYRRPAEAGRLTRQGHTAVNVVQDWWRAGIPLDEVAEWLGAGLTAEEAAAQRAKGITAEQAAALRALRDDPD